MVESVQAVEQAENAGKPAGSAVESAVLVAESVISFV
jgi:hypothetical protein